MNVHRDTQGPFHEQGWSPVTVALSLVSLTAAFLLRETSFGVGEVCDPVLCSAGSPGGSVPGTDLSVSPGAPQDTQDLSLGHLGSGHRSTGGI